MIFWVLLACGSDSANSPKSIAPVEEETKVRGPCNPIDDGHCLLPFPSDFYIQEGRLNFAAEGMPINIDEIPFETTYLHERDGFSIGTPLYVSLEDATMEGVIQWPDLEAYNAEDARTIIIDTSSGERIPHHVEREEQASEDGRRDLLIIRPMVPLKYEHRYVVGIRNLVNAQGEKVSSPDGFAKIREGTASDPDLLFQQSLYEHTIFPALEQEGFLQGELQLAWSFTTASKEGTLGRMLWMKEDTISRIALEGINYQIDEVVDEQCQDDHQGRVIHGHFSAPLYLEFWEPGGFLTRDETGMPFYNGQVDVPFLAIVGCSLIEGKQAGRLVQYGHGVMGSRSEANAGYLHQLADDYGWVIFASDWTGLKQQDATAIGLSLITDPTALVSVAERSQQGWIEGLTLSELMKQSDFGQELAFSADNTSLIDPNQLYFYGNSAGSVLGSGYISMHGGFERAVLGVGGMPFSVILARAKGFAPMLMLLESMYDDWADISLLLGLIQQTWDPAEGIGWSDETHPDVLVHLAIGDAGVPRISGHIMARRYDAILVEPYNREIWGLESQEGPFVGSGVAEWYFGQEDAAGPYPVELIDADPHDQLRQQASSIQQVGEFINTGIIDHYCDGPCDPD